MTDCSTAVSSMGFVILVQLNFFFGFGTLASLYFNFDFQFKIADPSQGSQVDSGLLKISLRESCRSKLFERKINGCLNRGKMNLD